MQQGIFSWAGQCKTWKAIEASRGIVDSLFDTIRPEKCVVCNEPIATTLGQVKVKFSDSSPAHQECADEVSAGKFS